MGADIWLGKRGESLGYFKDPYTGAITLNALRLSYWQDLTPKLLRGEEFPLELNDWLLGELRARVTEYLGSPKAAEYAREYLEEAGINSHSPEFWIEEWRLHSGILIELLERSSRLGIPLTMSL